MLLYNILVDSVNSIILFLTPIIAFPNSFTFGKVLPSIVFIEHSK